VHSAQSSLAVTHSSTNRVKRYLTSVTESPSKHWLPPRIKYHLQAVELSRVLITALVTYGNMEISTPHSSEISQVITIKLCTFDYVRETNTFAKFGWNPPARGCSTHKYLTFWGSFCPKTPKISPPAAKSQPNKKNRITSKPFKIDKKVSIEHEYQVGVALSESVIRNYLKRPLVTKSL